MKRLLNTLILVVFVLAVGTTISVPAKTLSTSKSKITVKKGTTKSVTITFKKTGDVYCKSRNKKIATASWAKNWRGDKIKLKIKAKKVGTTKIIVTNSKNSEKVIIKVKVTKKAKIKKMYNMHVIDDSWVTFDSYAITSYGDEWYDCINLESPFYSSIKQSYVIVCPNKKYKWFSGKIGIQANDSDPTRLKIYGDGKLIYTSPQISIYSSYKKFAINVKKYKFIKVAIDRDKGGADLLLTNAVFYN